MTFCGDILASHTSGGYRMSRESHWADVTGNWQLKPMDIWHERAVFHFLTSQNGRLTISAQLTQPGHKASRLVAGDSTESVEGAACESWLS